VGQALELRPRPTKPSLEELLGPATSREEWKTSESLSGSMLERVEIDGERFVLKHLHVDDDWIQRAQGDLFTKPLEMWRSGLFDALPPSIDHTIVDVASGFGRNGWGCAILMRDVSPSMIRIETIPDDVNSRFLDHMAELHARFWDFRDTVGLFPIGNRYFALTPLTGSIEAERGGTDPVPLMLRGGWERAFDASAALAKHVRPLLANPFPLVEAQARDPQSLVHGDWKAGNLGDLGDGRTVLLDWAFPGQASVTLDIAWYVSVNVDLLPGSKEDAIAEYRDGLKRHGIDTDGWWDRSLALSLLGLTLMMAWSKSGDELEWWADASERAVRYLG